MPHDLILLVVGAVVAGFVQGLSGFAFSMVAMSFWVWGLDPKLASVMAVFGSLTGQLLAMFSVRRAWHRATLAPYLIGGLTGIPLGVWVLPVLNPDVFKLALSLVLVLWCPLMLWSGSLPRITWGGRWADGLAGLLGGFMGGLGGITGAIPTLWSTLRGLPKDEQRAIIQNFNLSTLAVTFVAYLATGVVTAAMVPLFPVVAISLLVPVLLGMRLYSRLSQAGFRKMVLSLLTVSGVVMLAASLPKLLA
jgi:hypothetical protein